MAIYLLDTNALSRLARGIDKGLADKVALHVDDCVVSAVAWYELEYGAARSPDPVKSRQRLALIRTIFPFVRSFTEDDVLLAGQALALGAVLMTNNVRELTRVPRLIVEDWQTSA
jgi:tRNA(fMet)-specific endonuclease VapC